MEFVYLALLICCLFSIGVTIFLYKELLETSHEDEIMFFTPRELYNNTEMNMFGCTICSLLWCLAIPLYCIPVTIGWCIYKLCHVGRRN